MGIAEREHFGRSQKKIIRSIRVIRVEKEDFRVFRVFRCLRNIKIRAIRGRFIFSVQTHRILRKFDPYSGFKPNVISIHDKKVQYELKHVKKRKRREKENENT